MTDDANVTRGARAIPAARAVSAAPAAAAAPAGAGGEADGEPSRGERAAERSKFDLGVPPARFDGIELPWSYGEDRITALVRSPDSLYLYWEITDEAIAVARERLGAAGVHGWCNLRVYDTTGRDFDGTNANDYFDVRVERSDREYFLNLHRPSSAFHVEIGIKSHEGFFQAIARSGRADFPRKGPSFNHALEWMTVTTDDVHPAARPFENKHVPSPRPAWSSPPPPGGAGSIPPPSRGIVGNNRSESRTYTWTHPAQVNVRWEGPWIFGEWRAEWRLRWTGQVDTTGAHAVLPIEHAQWVVGPFPLDVLQSGRIDIRLLGEAGMVLQEHQSGLEVFGPWQVTIHNAPTEPERRVLATWRVHWVRVEPAKVERWWTAFEHRRTDAWQRTEVALGASESHALAEGGASEAWRMGASERWSIGASEWMALGGSEVGWLGASQLLLGGASALLYGGASGVSWGGASERQWGGASERPWGGASESLFAGSSGWLQGGASEHAALGASERFGAASAHDAYAAWLEHVQRQNGGADQERR
ncbi:MAG TPA: DUF4912 domain-containing protein [Polyangiaceae bacterium]|jgi:hypothetical protein